MKIINRMREETEHRRGYMLKTQETFGAQSLLLASEFRVAFNARIHQKGLQNFNVSLNLSFAEIVHLSNPNYDVK